MARTQWNTMNAETKANITEYATTYATRVAKRDAYRKSVKAYEDVIATDEEEIRKIALGKTEGICRTIDEIKESLKVNLQNLLPKKKAWEDEDKACAEIMSRIQKDVPKSLYEAYCKREVNPTEYTKAIKAWGESVGVNITDETARILRETIGDRESDRLMLKDNATMGLGNLGYDKYARIFVKKVAKLMGVNTTDDAE